jgi:hypothetical protein
MIIVINGNSGYIVVIVSYYIWVIVISIAGDIHDNDTDNHCSLIVAG